MDIVKEEPIPLAEASKHLLGGPVDVKTLVRWAFHGVGPGRAKLEILRSTGGRLFTTIEAIRRFEALRGRMEAASREFHPSAVKKPMYQHERDARRDDAISLLCDGLGMIRQPDGTLVPDPDRPLGRGRRGAIR